MESGAVIDGETSPHTQPTLPGLFLSVLCVPDHEQVTATEVSSLAMSFSFGQGHVSSRQTSFHFSSATGPHPRIHPCTLAFTYLQTWSYVMRA